MENYPQEKKIAICINNQDYPASLELRKIYQIITDLKAESHQMIRIIDESGEDYLYPTGYFVIVELPEIAQKLFTKVG